MNEPLNIRDYQIHLPPLGEGAFGRVYRATYRGISERALKIFRTPSVNLSQMARELEKLSSVAEHAGIVTLHDFDLLSDPPYYAMGLHADQVDDAWQTLPQGRGNGLDQWAKAGHAVNEVPRPIGGDHDCGLRLRPSGPNHGERHEACQHGKQNRHHTSTFVMARSQ